MIGSLYPAILGEEMQQLREELGRRCEWGGFPETEWIAALDANEQFGGKP